jgi:hypothetical protein
MEKGQRSALYCTGKEKKHEVYFGDPRYFSWNKKRKESNKVGKWKSCHQEREIEHFGVTKNERF